jgi:hypothetical protein
MLEGETYVLEGVRDVLRKKLGLHDNQCDCEFDEQIPSIADDIYIAVLGAGCDPGPTHSTSGGVHDLIHSVQVLVINRAVVARDKRRSIFLQRLVGINQQIANVIAAIDWQLDVLSYINHLLYVDFPTAKPFIASAVAEAESTSSRRWYRTICSRELRSVEKGTTPYIAMARSVYFGNMRRIQTVAQIAYNAKVAP